MLSKIAEEIYRQFVTNSEMNLTRGQIGVLVSAMHELNTLQEDFVNGKRTEIDYGNVILIFPFPGNENVFINIHRPSKKSGVRSMVDVPDVSAMTQEDLNRFTRAVIDAKLTAVRLDQEAGFIENDN